jgi:hypothetical protein
MSEEKRLVLEMVVRGTITAAEAEMLLRALNLLPGPNRPTIARHSRRGHLNHDQGEPDNG